MTKKYHIKGLLWELDPEGFHLIIKGKILKQPIYLLIDTGANHSCFDKTFIESIQPDNLIIGKDEKNVGIGGNDFETVIVEIQNLKIGRLLVPNYTIRLIDLRQVSEMYKLSGFHPIQGIIGGDFLRKYNALINYADATIELSTTNNR